MKNDENSVDDDFDGNLPSLSPADESSSSILSDKESVTGSAKQPPPADEKNKEFLENASHVIQKKIEQAQEYEEDHHILEKIREFTEDTYRSVATWAEDHRVVERSKTAAAQGTAFAISKIQECVRPSIGGAIGTSTPTATTAEPKTENV